MSMENKELLRLWRLDSSGASIPVDFTALCSGIEKLLPGEVGYKIVECLEADGVIETTVTGRRILTAKGLALRATLPEERAAPVPSAPSEAHWEEFRRLCGYYEDCVTQSEKKQEFLFEDGRDVSWFLPQLPVDWLTAARQITIKPPASSEVAVNRLKIADAGGEADIMLGYPLNCFAISGGKLAYSPVLLFPVDFTFDLNRLSLTLRRDEIDINQSWLEFNMPRDEQQRILRQICFADGETSGLLNPELAVRFLGQKLGKKLASSLDPALLDFSAEPRPGKVLNQAALFVCSDLKFSKTLKRELRHIAGQPVEILDQTALAFVFRNPPKPYSTVASAVDSLPLDFLEHRANKEQGDAIGLALASPVSKITGPPGTGKSQVAANLIANLVFRQRPVLFASKNHKAIHAIHERCDQASPAPNLSFASFTTLPDGSSNGADWTKMRIDDEAGRHQRLKTERQISETPPCVREFFDSLEIFDEWREDMRQIDRARALRQDIAAKLESCEENLPPGASAPTVEFRDQIAALVKRANAPEPQRRAFLLRLLDFIMRRRVRAENAGAELRALLPELAAQWKERANFVAKASRLASDISDFLALSSEEARLRATVPTLPATAEKLLADGIALRQRLLKEVLLARRIVSVLGIANDPVLTESARNAALRFKRLEALPFLAAATRNGKADDDRGAFACFLKVFPAWCATLLSLRKTSPCAPAAFDRVIIDEASQCEIPPLIPALFRAKGVCVIGDPEQFPPIITMRENRHYWLRFSKHKLTGTDERFDYRTGNAFDIIPCRPLMLREHFRCVEGIAGYFNDTYYNGKLRVRTGEPNLVVSRAFGFQPGITWHDVEDSAQGEIDAACARLRDLKANGYTGTIGVISPFRKTIEILQQALVDLCPMLDIQNDVNTVNGFQGGERDLIIFVLGLNSETERGQQWYAEAADHKHIYNVAVSRAKVCFIAIGDKKRALRSASRQLRDLAAREQRPRPTLSQSPGEETMFRALKDAGLAPVQQYPLAGRWLDLALVDAKLDIEIDGEAWHLNRYGERKQEDIYRDLLVQSCGWRVIRFWHREVMADPAACAAKVKAALRVGTTS